MGDGRLAGKTALVTGAGSGIGRAIAVRFASEGARVGVNWLHNRRGAEETLRLVRGAGSEGMLLRADVSREPQVRRMIHAFIKGFGGIDVLVCNSGIGTEKSPDRVTEILEKDWDRVIAVNLKGLMLASKGGEVLLTKQMALDYARHGVRVNCICPGFVLTEMLEGYIAGQADPQEARRLFASMSPMNRIGAPEEIASAALFLASEASSFVTGAALPVDGGYTAYGVRSIL